MGVCWAQNSLQNYIIELVIIRFETQTVVRLYSSSSSFIGPNRGISVLCHVNAIYSDQFKSACYYDNSNHRNLVKSYTQ